MPVWAAVIIGLGTGVASGLLGTILTISHQRGAEFRSRMLRAAEDFLRAAEQVRRLIRQPEREPVDAIRFVRAAWEDLVPTVTLVELLYGRDSQTAHLARATGNELQSVEEALQAVIQGERAQWAAVNEHMAIAGEAINEFGRNAALDVRQGWLRRRPRAIRWRVRTVRDNRRARRTPET